MAKVIKGSAIQTEDNGFIFTPYNTNPPENTPWIILQATARGMLKCTEDTVQLRISLKKPNTVRELQNILLSDFSKLIANIDVAKLYGKRKNN
ncbi:MAG: hypothetical protein IJ624_07220 [Prevotella sp.]|nr:hypothetical protein [Prevotella sp.]